MTVAARVAFGSNVQGPVVALVVAAAVELVGDAVVALVTPAAEAFVAVPPPELPLQPAHAATMTAANQPRPDVPFVLMS
jgi:hypothetical protein